MASAQANRRGIVLMLVAMGCYVLNDVFAKLAAPGAALFYNLGTGAPTSNRVAGR